MGPKSKESLINQLKEEPPVVLFGLSNAWCQSALVRGELVLINLVQTERSNDERRAIFNGRATA